MWSTSARGFQRAKQATAAEAGAAVPTASGSSASHPAQNRSGKRAGPAPPPAAAAKARGHPAPPPAGKPAPRATTPSPTKPRHNGGGGVKQQTKFPAAAAAPAQQSLKQAAAQARTERLRSALQQLRAGRGAADSHASVGSHGGEAAVQHLGSSTSTAAPALQQQQPLPQAAAAVGLAAPTACTASSCEPELDSDLEDLFDGVSLDLLARLRLGGQRAVQPAAPGELPSGSHLSQPQQPAVGADVLAAARRALHEAAAEPEMPVLRRGSSAITSAGAAPFVTAAAAAVAAPSQSSPPCSAAAAQQQPERLRSSLSASPSLPAPMPLAVHQGRSAGRPAVASPGGERRAELVLTRPPSLQAAGVPPTMPAVAARTSASASHALMVAPPGSPYSSSGSTPAARLAALLLQPARQPPGPPGLHLDPAPPQHSRPAALLQPGWADHQFSSTRQLAASHPAALLHSAQPALTHHAATRLSSPAGTRAAVTSSPAGSVAAMQQNTVECSGGSGTSWRAGSVHAPPGQAGDILAEWRARRQQQAPRQVQPGQQQGGTLADRYSRFLSLRQPEASAPSGLGPAAAAAVAGRRAGAEALLLGGRLGRPPVAVAATASSSSNSSIGGTLSSLPAAEPEGGDILARWRARRRQQAQAVGSSGADDLTPLLALHMPGAAARHAGVPKQPAAGAEHLAAAATSSPRQPAIRDEPGRPTEAGNSSGRGGRQLGLAAPSVPPVPVRPSSSMRPVQAQSGLQLSPAVLPPVDPPAVPQSVGATVSQPPSATAALAAVPQQQLQGANSRAAEQAVEPREAVDSGQPAVELPQSQSAAAAAGAELALVQPAAAAAVESEPAICQQPSRPPSAASSGRATPLSSLALTSCSSAAWSPGISRLLDECIGGYFAGGCSSMQELAVEAESAEGSFEEGAMGGAAAGGGASSTSCSVMAGEAVGGSSRAAAEACPDPADLPFLSAACSPAAGCEKRPPPAGGVVATARALLAEAVMLLDQPGAGCAAAAGAAGPTAAEGAAGAAVGAEGAAAVAEPATPTAGSTSV